MNAETKSRDATTEYLAGMRYQRELSEAEIDRWIQSATEVHDQLKIARAALLAITKVRWEDGAGDAADEMQRLASEAYRETAWEMKDPSGEGSGVAG